MSMSMRDTIHNEQAKEDIKALMKSALKKPNAAVGQSGLQVCPSKIFLLNFLQSSTMFFLKKKVP